MLAIFPFRMTIVAFRSRVAFTPFTTFTLVMAMVPDSAPCACAPSGRREQAINARARRSIETVRCEGKRKVIRTGEE
jgi:hypothetical protein